MNRFLYILIIVFSSLQINAQDFPIFEIEIDPLSCTPLSTDMYSVSLVVYFDSLSEFSNLGIAIWETLPEYSPTIEYFEGDEVLWGLSFMDTVTFLCIADLPYPGISPTGHDSSNIYWEEQSQLVFLELNEIFHDTTMNFYIAAGNLTYYYSEVMQYYHFKGYWIDSLETLHSIETGHPPVQLPFSNGTLTLELSHYDWNYSVDVNILTENGCTTDTITGVSTVTGFFNEPVPNTTLSASWLGAILISSYMGITDDSGQAIWKFVYPIELLIPMNPDSCNPPNCNNCEYEPFETQFGIYFGIFGGGGVNETNPAFVTLTRDNECLDCPNIISGCTEIDAWNYNSDANHNDGTCLHKGDLNTDLEIDVYDVLRVADLLLPTDSIPEYELWSGDLNGDMVLSLEDIYLLIGYIIE